MKRVEASGARQLTTLAAGEYISVRLRDDRGQGGGLVGGTVVAVDAVAIRIALEWRRRDLWPEPASGQTIVLWTRVADICVGGGR